MVLPVPVRPSRNSTFSTGWPSRPTAICDRAFVFSAKGKAPIVQSIGDFAARSAKRAAAGIRSAWRVKPGPVLFNLRTTHSTHAIKSSSRVI